MSVGDLEYGDKVRSVAIGRLPAFEGTVLEIITNGKGERIYHIADKSGNWWVRTRDELRRL